MATKANPNGPTTKSVTSAVKSNGIPLEENRCGNHAENRRYRGQVASAMMTAQVSGTRKPRRIQSARRSTSDVDIHLGPNLKVDVIGQSLDSVLDGYRRRSCSFLRLGFCAVFWYR